MPFEKYGQMSNYVPSLGKVILADNSMVPNLQAAVASAGLTGLVGLARDYGLPNSLVNTNYDNFAPRVGFAWRPFGNNRTVLRSGSSLSAIRTGLTSGFPFSQSFTGSTSNPSLLTLGNPFLANSEAASACSTELGF